MLTNSWPTKARMFWKFENTNCIFCDKKIDSPEHFWNNTAQGCVCIQNAVWQINESPIDTDKIFGVNPIEKNDKWGNILYAVYRTHNDLIHRNDIQPIHKNIERIIARYNIISKLSKGTHKGKKEKTNKKHEYIKNCFTVFYKEDYWTLQGSDNQHLILRNPYDLEMYIEKDKIPDQDKRPIHIYTDGSGDSNPLQNNNAGWGITVLGLEDKPLDFKGKVPEVGFQR